MNNRIHPMRSWNRRSSKALLRIVVVWLTFEFLDATCSVASGAEIYWNGAVNARFSEPENWVGGRVPGIGDSVVVSAHEPFTSDVVIEEGDDIRVDRVWMDLVDAPRTRGIQFGIQLGNLNAATFHVVDSGWPSVVGGTLAVDELIFGPTADQTRLESGMSIHYGDLNIGRGGIKVTAEDPSWFTTIVLEKASIDLTQSANTPFHISHGTLGILMAPGSSMRLPGQFSLPGDEHVRVASFIPGICGGRLDVDILQSDYDAESGATEIRVPDAGLAGDADRDGDFDQLDLVRVQIADKYLSGEPATWGEGDWDGWQRRNQEGDGLFNQHDVIAALRLGIYLTSGCEYARKPYAKSGDAESAGQVNVSVHITDVNVIESVFDANFGSASLAHVAEAGSSEQFVHGGVTVLGSLVGGRDLDDVQTTHVPEPKSALLCAIGAAVGFMCFRRAHWFVYRQVQ